MRYQLTVELEEEPLTLQVKPLVYQGPESLAGKFKDTAYVMLWLTKDAAK